VIGPQAQPSEIPSASVRGALDGSKSHHGPWLAAAVGLLLLIGLVSAPRADAVPIVTYKCTPAPQDCSGWYRSNVSIDWTVLPSDAAVIGCQDKTYTSDTSGTNELCNADDGVASVTVQLKIRLDQTPPEATAGTPSRAAGVNGWYSSPVGVTFAGTDQTSGIESCSAITYSGPDSAAASLSGTCRDKAGNVSASFPYGLKYDQTNPSVTGAAPEHPANAAGWFNQPVAFDLQGTDSTAGIASCSSKTYSGPDSATASFGGTCTDMAGNSAARDFGLKYDATAPTATGAQAARDPDTNRTAGTTTMSASPSPAVTGPPAFSPAPRRRTAGPTTEAHPCPAPASTGPATPAARWDSRSSSTRRVRT